MSSNESSDPRPSWATPRNPDRATFGPAVAELAERMGTPLFPWQRLVVDVALEVEADGSWAYDEIVITVPRRSGKSFMIKPVTAHRCGAGRCSAWITAQKRVSAVNRWRDAADGLLATRLPGLRRKVGAGQESLSWSRTGSIFRPFAPNEDAMHGEDPDLVWVDELWAFSTDQRRMIEQGYKPAWSVRPGQAWLLSTAGTQRSEWLNTVRRQGRNAVDHGSRVRRAFFEWSVDEAEAEAANDDRLVELVIDRHPRRDHGLRRAYLVEELEQLGRSAFLRAYGNVTQSEDEAGIFPGSVVDRARSGARIPGDARIGLSVAVDEDRRDAAIGVGWRNPSGVAVTDERRAEGTRWVAGEVIRLVDQHAVGVVAIRNAGPGRDIADELDRAGVPLLRVSAGDYAAACSRFADEFGADYPSVTWNGSAEFAKALTVAAWRKVPSGRVWESRTGASIVPLEARTLAVWSADHAPDPEPVIMSPEVW